MRSILLQAIFLASCATERVASGDSLRISTNHYRSMVGVTLKESESTTTCNREMITGSHIPRWYCRFGNDPTQYEPGRRIVFTVR